jgi:hypothetical protein
VNIWGYCERCDRWFKCPDAGTAEWVCVSCDTEPLLIENRDLIGRARPESVTTAD